MKFSIMTSPHYYDVTPFSTDSNENGTAYVKLNSKIFLFVDLFWFSEYLLRKLRFITKIPSIVQLPHTFHISLLSSPFGWVLLETDLPHTWGYFYNTKQNKKIIVFTKNGENQGRSLSAHRHKSKFNFKLFCKKFKFWSFHHLLRDGVLLR